MSRYGNYQGRWIWSPFQATWIRETPQTRAGELGGKITIADKDRLCRFGYELFEDVCRYNGTEIVVLNAIENDPDRELADDLLTICNVFVATKNGQSPARNKKERAKAFRENRQE
eukprot:NODE_738_length_4687_cov_0.308849.p9 type:complete len:115 gc:universal NODE_738_length_4687_cov_0.308849:3933-3589(-)